MFMTGLMIFLGVTFVLVKLPRRRMLKTLKHDVALDVAVTVAVLVIHFGTFSGVMAATVAGLLMSMATSSMKKLVGYIDGNTYYPGIFCLKL